MFRLLATTALLATAALVLGVAQLAAEPAKTSQTATGALLTDMAGMTLYTFDKDMPGVSNCLAECLVNWPVLAAAEGDAAMGDYAVIARPDGLKQWSYKGMPLYTFIKDAAPGEVKGDGVKGVWHIARP